MGAVGLQVLTPDLSLLEFAHLRSDPLLALGVMLLPGHRVLQGWAGTPGLCLTAPLQGWIRGR